MKRILGNAELLFNRVYRDPRHYLPLYLLLIQGSDPSSVHSPPSSYRDIGFKIEEEGSEQLNVTHWAEPVSSVTINKLLVSNAMERIVTLYFYLKQTSSLGGDRLTLVRMSAVVPTSISYEEMLSIAKDFMGDIIAHMFEPEEEKEALATGLIKRGISGWLVVVISLVVPVLIMVYPRIRKGTKEIHQT